MGLRRGLSIGFLLGVVAALLGRILTAENNKEQWEQAKAEAESAAATREASLRTRHAAARQAGRLPDDPDRKNDRSRILSVPNTRQAIDHAAFTGVASQVAPSRMRPARFLPTRLPLASCAPHCLKKKATPTAPH